MNNKEAFSKFAPSILRIYHRDKEAFWAAVMAPFLSKESSLLNWWQHLKVDVGLLNAFKGLNDDSNNVLREFSAPFGFDLTKWKSNREQYFKDAYPVFAFLAVWMDEQGLSELIESFGEILEAGVFAVAGYGILDENVDRNISSPVEILTSQALIAEYEMKALNIFGVTQTNLGILHKMRSLFLGAEIKEKFMRGKGSPYSLDKPQNLGTKGANAVSPFMLSLERLGKTVLIDDYWEVFLLFGAAIQMIDDWQDLESDLTEGHYSYVTLGYENIYQKNIPSQAATILKANKSHVRETYICAKEMITQSRTILKRLDDNYLIRLVDVTELRMDNYFRKNLKTF